MSSAKECSHLAAASERKTAIEPGSRGCKECLESGDAWVHLRLCLECGHVGCCDSSPNRHATKHFHSTRHPVIKSFEPGEDWAWCYVDERTAEPFPCLAEESPLEHIAPGAFQEPIHHGGG